MKENENTSKAEIIISIILTMIGLTCWWALRKKCGSDSKDLLEQAKKKINDKH